MARTNPIGTAPPSGVIHDLLSAYPLVCFTGALATDLTYRASADMMWANFSIWLMTGGLIVGVLAAFLGLFLAIRDRPTGSRRVRVWVYAVGTGLMLIVGTLNAFVHSRDGWTSVVPTGLTLSAVVAVLALAVSWLGYSLRLPRETL